MKTRAIIQNLFINKKVLGFYLNLIDNIVLKSIWYDFGLALDWDSTQKFFIVFCILGKYEEESR